MSHETVMIPEHDNNVAISRSRPGTSPRAAKNTRHTQRTVKRLQKSLSVVPQPTCAAAAAAAAETEAPAAPAAAAAAAAEAPAAATAGVLQCERLSL